MNIRIADNDDSVLIAIIENFSIEIKNNESLNIMKISKPENAILASLIYNLLFILVMILCLIKWNKFKSLFHSRLYLKITLLCTFVGIVMPFIVLKLIDGLITFWRIF